MSSFIPFDRSQPYFLPPDLKSWLPADDMAHFVVASVERVPMNAFSVLVRTGGRAQYHPRLMLALLIFRYANGLFSSRRIERATYRDIGVRFVAVNLHPDHDTIATFRRTNRAAIETAFAQVLLLARETGLVRLGVVSIDGTKIDTDASKYRSVRYDRIRALREQLVVDIAELMEQAERADATDTDPQALPEELTRRETLKAKLDAACARLEADAREQAASVHPAYEKKKAEYDAKTGRRDRAPKPPDEEPPPGRQISLTDPNSRLMRRSDAHEFRQAYNAQAVVCAEGSQLIVTTGVVATSADAPSFADTVQAMEDIIVSRRRRSLTPVTPASKQSGDCGEQALIRWSPSDAPVLADLTISARSLKKGGTPDYRTLASRHEGKTEKHGGRKTLQTEEADRKAGLRNYQKCHGLQKIQPARPCKSYH